MAYVSQTSDEEKNKLNTQGGTTVSTGTTTNTTPNQSGSGWVNLDKYLNANQEQTQEMYKPELEQVAKEGSDIGSNLQSNYDTYKNNLQTGLSDLYTKYQEAKKPIDTYTDIPSGDSASWNATLNYFSPFQKASSDYNKQVQKNLSKYNYDPSQYKTDYETYKNKYSDISAGDLNTMLQNKYGNRNVSTGVNTLNQYLTKQAGLPEQFKSASESSTSNFNNLYDYLNNQSQDEKNKLSAKGKNIEYQGTNYAKNKMWSNIMNNPNYYEKDIQ